MIIKRKKRLMLFLLLFVLVLISGCKKSTKIVKIDSRDNEIIQVTTESKNMNLLDNIDSSFLQNTLSNGVWLSSLSGFKKERELSFGKTWITPSHYLIFEFNSVMSFLYYGFSEGGPAFDHVVGSITRITPITKNFYEVEYNLVTNLNGILDQNGFLSQKKDSVFSHEKAKIIFLLENGKLNMKEGTMIGSDVLGRALSFEKNTRQENEYEYEYESIINDNNVRVRSGPSLLESVIGYCTKNQKIHIISKSVRPENIENQFDYWFEVEFENGVHGWVYGAFIDSKSKETVPINDKAQMVSESER